MGSVAEMNDSGNLVLFDTEGSYSINAKSPEAAAIRKAVRRCKRATKIHRCKNSYFIPLWVQSEMQTTEKDKVAPFGGQGKP